MPRYLEYIRKAGVLIEALPYIQSFRDSTVVIKLGGSVLEDEEVFESALRDIVFLECVGINPVIVHGGGKDISARLAEMGIETKFINGLRYTCKDTISVVDSVLHNDVNPRVVGAIDKHGGKAKGISGKEILHAQKIEGKGDLGFVGEVVKVDAAPIDQLLKENYVPVITPVGIGEDGRAYNINADVSACRIAQELKAQKLVFMSDVPGLLSDPSNEDTLISTIRIAEVNGLIEDGVISGGMVPKVQSAVSAIQAGCRKVHMIDARLQHSVLLEIFTDRGVGTQIIE